jgi:hypothetical protein
MAPAPWSRVDPSTYVPGRCTRRLVDREHPPPVLKGSTACGTQGVEGFKGSGFNGRRVAVRAGITVTPETARSRV